MRPVYSCDCPSPHGYGFGNGDCAMTRQFRAILAEGFCPQCGERLTPVKGERQVEGICGPCACRWSLDGDIYEWVNLRPELRPLL